MADYNLIKDSLRDERWIERGILFSAATVILFGLGIFVLTDKDVGISVAIPGGIAFLSYLAGRKSPRKPTIE